MRRQIVLIAALVGFALIIMAAPASAQQGPPQTTLNWTAPTVATPAALTFLVERATAAAGPWNTLATPSATTYVDTAVTRGTTYFWRVSSVCPPSGAGCGTASIPVNGTSAPAGPVTGTIPAATTPPPSPSNLVIGLQ